MPGHSHLPGRQKLPDSLPLPDPDALDHSRKLTGQIVKEIAQSGGRLPFDRYMELCLYAPGLGYYSGGLRKFGESGDFVTAPEVSPVFARCLSRQCRQVLAELRGGDLLEFGAGSGRLAVDMLRELDRLGQLPERYFILEVSAELRDRQARTLQKELPELVDRVHWLDRLPDAGFRGVVIANELLDAMPVHRFRIEGDRILEQHVRLGEGQGVVPSWGPCSDPLESAVRHLLASDGGGLDDYESEINLRAAPWVRALAQRVQAGLILLIDYGYTRGEYYHPRRSRGTLMCHYRHRAHPDPMLMPGLQDITAHVDFTRVAAAALKSGLNVCGYTSQAFFLMGCGLDRLISESNPENVRSHMELVQGVKRLTLPTEMGERFKVLGLSRGLKEAPVGFSIRDQRERL